MTIVHFKSEEDTQEYLEWRKQNPEGYVLNINTWTPNSKTMKNIIHKASGCFSLDNPPTANRDRPVTSEHHKLCSTDIRKLEDEMIAKKLRYKPCGHCMKKG